jgi:hypothetical protein
MVSIQGELDPGDIWMLAIEVARNHFDQYWEGGSALRATGLPQREHPLHPAIAFRVVAALHALAPDYGKPQRGVQLREGITACPSVQNRAGPF